MSLANMVAVLHGDSSGPSLLDAAVALAQQHGALLTCVHVEIDSSQTVPTMITGMAGSVAEAAFEQMQEDIAARATAAQAQFETLVQSSGLPVIDDVAAATAGEAQLCYRQLEGMEADNVAETAKLMDLVMMAKPEVSRIGSMTTFEAVLFETCRPIMIVPEASAKAFGVSVAVAWNGTREAACSVFGALPLLTAAESVSVLSGHTSDEKSHASQLAEFLALKGIDSKTWGFTLDKLPDGEQLLVQAGKAEADMLVMGGYGHSRLRETVLGGATRSVLEQTTIPVVFAH